MVSESTRSSLLDRLRDVDDEEAWREFDRKYRELIVRYCHRRGLQHWDAEDVRQVVLLSLSKALRSFRYDPGAGRFRGYLGRVVQNAINRQLSRPSASPRVLDAEVLAAIATPTGGENDQVWQEEWYDHHLRMAMRTIRDNTSERDVHIFDRLLTGETVRSVAQDLRMGEQAVYKVKQRVRDQLKALIAAQIRAEDGVRGS